MQKTEIGLQTEVQTGVADRYVMFNGSKILFPPQQQYHLARLYVASLWAGLNQVPHASNLTNTIQKQVPEVEQLVIDQALERGVDLSQVFERLAHHTLALKAFSSEIYDAAVALLVRDAAADKTFYFAAATEDLGPEKAMVWYMTTPW